MTLKIKIVLNAKLSGWLSCVKTPAYGSGLCGGYGGGCYGGCSCSDGLARVLLSRYVAINLESINQPINQSIKLKI